MDNLRFCRVRVEDERILVLTIDRERQRNALSAEASAELARVWDHFEADPALWVAIVTGAGDRAFCAGFDLKSEPAENPTGFAGLAFRQTLRKPVIAAVNGLAHGGGFELALACDVILASERASFALPEPKRGLAALAGGLVRLPRLIGMQRALALILTGDEIDAAEAHRQGIVNEVVPHEKLLPRALEIARRMLACSPDSLAASKRIVALALATPDVFAAMQQQYELPEVAAMLGGDNLAEGLAAFAEKRAPRWVGASKL